MSEKSHDSWTSRETNPSTIVPDDDARHLFKGVVADINFRFPSASTPTTIQRRSVYEILNGGPASIMGSARPQVRWIHLPANNMAWVEDLMKRLQEEQTTGDAQTNEESNEVSKFDGVLREDLWRHAFHGRHSNSIHSRFMMPLSTRYSSIDLEGPESDESDETWHNANVIAVYLPYLHWEFYNSWKDRQQRIARLKKLALERSECDCLDGSNDLFSYEARKNEVLLHQYLSHDSPLHDRRSLDQSYFYNLRNVAHHDEDQVIGQHTWNRTEQNDPERKMMMTDQLWMWVINDKTIITAFPETGTNTGKEEDVLNRLLENLPASIQQGTTKSVNGLAALIIDHCTGVFHRSDINPNLAFRHFFADAIGAARTEVDRMLHDFRGISDSIETLWRDQSVSPARMSRELDALFSIKKEIQLLEGVEKIVSDLDKIDFLVSQQEDVLRSFLKCHKSTTHRSTSRTLTDLCEIISSRRAAWAGLSTTARATHKSLHTLLDLKQRQATVSEARTVRFQVEITARQGRSIMLLTIFTIFFLPISVMAAIFGMNATELVGREGGKLSVSTISAIMFPTSVTLVLVALVLAFSEEAREVVGGVCGEVYRRVMGTGTGTGKGVGRWDWRV